jgi:hypothetical protein
MPADPVIEFWDWFRDFSDDILAAIEASDPEGQNSLRELNRRVRRIDPGLRWEIGPFLGDTTFLAISYNFRQEPYGNRSLTRSGFH